MLRQYPQNCILGTQRKTLNDFVCRKISFLFGFEVKTFVLWVKTFSSLLKTESYVYRSLLMVFTWFLLWFWTYQTLSEILPVWLAKASLAVQKVLEKKRFHKFFIFGAFWSKVFHTSDKNFRQSTGFGVVRSLNKIIEEKFPGKKIAFIIYYELQRKVLRLSLIFFWHALHNFIFHLQSSMLLAKKVWEWKEFNKFFRSFSRWTPHSRRNCSDSMPETAFYVPREKH